jgi:hypothetical protein
VEVKRLAYCIFEQCKAKGAEDNGEDSMETVWGVFLWSLHFLSLGIWPTCNFDGSPFEATSAEALLAGSPLAGGLRAARPSDRSADSLAGSTLHG